MKTVIELRYYAISALYEIFVNGKYICCGPRLEMENIGRRLHDSIPDSLYNSVK